jgi:hypothetical protein
LEEHFNNYCDDAKQNGFHTKSVMDATFNLFLTGRPWLKVAHRAVVQSDNAGNYRDPTVDIDMVFIGTRIFSEPGMGKDEEDKNGADNKSGIRRYRDQRHGLECASDVLEAANSLALKAQTNGILSVSRCFEGKGKASNRVPVPGISNFSMWCMKPDEIIFWESVDLEGSYESMAAGGQAVGFGPGFKITKCEFDKKHRTGAAETGATLSFGKGKDPPKPNPKQRPSREEKKAASVTKAAIALSKQQRAEAIQQMELTRSEADYANAVNTCPRCKQMFLTAGWFASHTRRWCIDKEEARKERMSIRHVPCLLEASDSLAVTEYARRIAALPTATVTLKGTKDWTEIGIQFKTRGGNLVVDDLTKTGLAFFSSQIGCGWVLSSATVDGNSGLNVTAMADLKNGQSIQFVFIKTRPDIPLPGMARMGIHKQIQFVFHPVQLEWLETNAFSDGKQQLRAKVAWESMKARFSNIMRTDTMTPMWIEQGRIEEWLAKRVRSEKDFRKAARQAEKARISTASSENPPKKNKYPQKSKKREAEAESEEESGTEEESESEEEETEGEE